MSVEHQQNFEELSKLKENQFEARRFLGIPNSISDAYVYDVNRGQKYFIRDNLKAVEISPNKYATLLPLEASGIPHELGSWIDEVISSHNKRINPQSELDYEAKEKKYGYFEYCLIELGKNALHHGNTPASITIEFKDKNIECSVEDSGSGFDNLVKDIEYSSGGGYGFKEALKYMDSFKVYTQNNVYEKKGSKMRKIASVDYPVGVKIVAIKTFK